MNRLVIVAILLSVAAAASAQHWDARMQASTDALKAGDYARALKIDDGVIDEMMSSLGEGEGAARAFAIVLTQRALALAGLGLNEDATWAWHEALSLDPRLEHSDVGDFGAAGKFLLDHPLPAETRSDGDAIKPLPKGSGSVPPRIKKRVEPRYPLGARLGRDVAVVVEVQIDEEGVVRDGRILDPLTTPTLSHAAMEAVRQWRFTPAMLDGKKVPFVLDLTVNFRS